MEQGTPTPSRPTLKRPYDADDDHSSVTPTAKRQHYDGPESEDKEMASPSKLAASRKSVLPPHLTAKRANRISPSPPPPPALPNFRATTPETVPSAAS